MIIKTTNNPLFILPVDKRDCTWRLSMYSVPKPCLFNQKSI